MCCDCHDGKYYHQHSPDRAVEHDNHHRAYHIQRVEVIPMATHSLPPPPGSYEDLFYKAITFCKAKDCTAICSRNQNTKTFKAFLEKLNDDFWYYDKDFSKDCDDYQKKCHSLYRDCMPVPTCEDCRNLIYGKSDTWKGACWMTRHTYWCYAHLRELLLEPCRTKACSCYERRN